MRHHPLTPWAFLAIPLALYAVWVIYPTFATFYMAFTNWDGFSSLADAQIIGLENFRRLFQDSTFWKALTNNLKWVAVFITIPTSIGLVLAMALDRTIKFDRFLKISYYLPMVLAFVVIALVWSWIYHPTQGLFNNTIAGFLGIFEAIGVDVDPGSARRIGWLSNPDLVLWSIIGAAVWRQVGYVMILYLAGLKTVDPALVDAARVDGAQGWSMFRWIIFPLLAPITTIVVVISIIDSLRAFDLVWVMTRGGPFHSSNVLANFMYIEAFNNYSMGYAAAIGVILFLISLAFIAIYMWRLAREEDLA